MKKFLLVIFLLFCIALLLANTSSTITLELTLGDECIARREVSISTYGGLLLSGICGGDIEKMANVVGSKLGAIETLNPSLIKAIVECTQSLYVEPTEASVRWDGQTFDFCKEKCGYYVDANEVIASIVYSDGKLVGALKRTPIAPTVIYDEVTQWTQKITSFSTSYHSSDSNRRHNVELASSALDGYTLARGKSMSFNAVVGKRTEERGYKDATVILNGQFTSGLGGGVCQVSSTLYNLAILSGLDVTSSANHSLPVSYVAWGRDAMVSDNTDLIIANNTDADVFLSVKAEGGIIKMTSYSKRTTANQDIAISYQLERTIPSSYKTVLVDKLDENNQPYEKITKEKRDGMVVSSYVTKKINGKTTTTKLRTSYYKPCDGEVEKTNPVYLLDRQKDSAYNAGHIVSSSA